MNGRYVMYREHRRSCDQGEAAGRCAFGHDDCPIMKEKADREAFERRQDEILGGVPEAFRGFVRGYAWQQGHASGYSEVLGIATDIVEQLRPAIVAFSELEREVQHLVEKAAGDDV